MFRTQVRSSFTRAAFIEAMERAIEEKPIELISIAELARRAGKSVGAFYTKFRDKDEVLDAVLDRYDAQRSEVGDSAFLLEKWRGTTLRERINAIALATVTEFRSRRGLFLAYERRAQSRPIPFPAEETLRSRPLFDTVAKLLADCADEIKHPDPERASRFAFFLGTSLCKSAILHSSDSHALTLRMSDEELSERTAMAMYAYLAKEPQK